MAEKSETNIRRGEKRERKVLESAREEILYIR
jgi:hypothetical protein